MLRALLVLLALPTAAAEPLVEAAGVSVAAEALPASAAVVEGSAVVHVLEPGELLSVAANETTPVASFAAAVSPAPRPASEAPAQAGVPSAAGDAVRAPPSLAASPPTVPVGAAASVPAAAPRADAGAAPRPAPALGAVAASSPPRSVPVGGAPPVVAAVAGALLLAFAVGALYARLRRDRLLDHELRVRVLAALELAPATAAELARGGGVHLTTMLHHLRKLEAAGLVASRRGDAATWWTVPGRVADVRVLEATRVPAARRLAETARAAPGATATELAAAASLSLSLACYHLARLAEAGVLLEEEGRWRPARGALEDRSGQA